MNFRRIFFLRNTYFIEPLLGLLVIQQKLTDAVFRKLTVTKSNVIEAGKAARSPLR